MKIVQTLQKGQALITLLFFMAIMITITSAAVIILIVNMQTTTDFEQGTRAYYVAESGAENAVLRILRDPFYTGEVLTIDDGTATISVSGTGPYSITSSGRVNDYLRTIQVTLSNTNGSFEITDWREI